MSDSLTTGQLTCILSTNCATRPLFLGVYPCDLLPKRYISKRPALVVANTDKNGMPGEHWVGVYLSMDSVSYFDPYGLGPHNQYIREFLERNGNTILCNNFQLQPLGSDACGKYVATYLCYRAMEKTLGDYLNAFQNCVDVDHCVRDTFRRLFGNVKTCRFGQRCKPAVL